MCCELPHLFTTTIGIVNIVVGIAVAIDPHLHSRWRLIHHDPLNNRDWIWKWWWNWWLFHFFLSTGRGSLPVCKSEDSCGYACQVHKDENHQSVRKVSTSVISHLLNESPTGAAVTFWSTEPSAGKPCCASWAKFRLHASQPNSLCRAD